jgi:branched-chain amino acid aminotransferase
MFISFNGKITPADQPVLQASNRSYRYGDGLFETMKLAQGKIRLEELHFQRLMKGLELLKFERPKLFTTGKLAAEIIQLAEKNQVRELGRVRLSVFRGNGGLYDADRALQYLIECWPLPDSFSRLNENGLEIGIYPDAPKPVNLFSGLKSANFLPYTMASIYAKENKLNDCLLLNQEGEIADSTIANLFICKEGQFITPGPEQGAVDGVMRNYLVREMRAAGYAVEEGPVSISALEAADEVFLSNAIHGVKWVRRFRDSIYTNKYASDIYSRIIQTIPR